MSWKLGTSFAIGWAICLVIAFVLYPKPDNLLVSYAVYLISGEDGLEQLSGRGAFAISAIQVLLMFCIGYVSGGLIGRGSKGNNCV